MITLDSSVLTEKENAKLLSGSILPRPIALVSTLQENQKINMAPFSYFNIVSANPPMISISVRRDQEVQKDTSRNIIRNKEFVVHIISPEFLEQANKTATILGRDESEVEYANLTPVKSEQIATPGIAESKVRMECEYVTHVEFEHTDLIIGTVKMYHVDEQVYDQGKIKLDVLNPVSRLSGSRYSLVGTIIPMDKPKEKK